MIKMKKEPRIKINWQAQRSYAGAFDDRYIPGNRFVTKDGWHYCRLSISRYSKTREMDICHELGHLLSCRKDDLSKKDIFSVIRREVMAWRLGRSFCLPQHWLEDEARGSVLAVFEEMDNWVDIYEKIGFNRIKFTPINKGFSLK